MVTLLLIHGIPGSAATWRRVASVLEDHHQVLVPDLLGFGGQRCPGDDDSLLAPNQARHLLDLLDRAGVDRMAVADHDCSPEPR